MVVFSKLCVHNYTQRFVGTFSRLGGGSVGGGGGGGGSEKKDVLAARIFHVFTLPLMEHDLRSSSQKRQI